MRTTHILFVVCHPDDEALWVGGLLDGLSQFPGVAVHVICLSGQDQHSPRLQEFEAARAVAGYHSGVVMGGELRPANQPLPAVALTVVAGLEKLGLTEGDVDVLITHSPFGEEHMHPHHVQASIELSEWTSRQGIAFGYFSCLPLPTCRLQPMLKNMKRFGKLQVLNYAQCQYGLLRRVIRWYERKPWRYPRVYIQWLVDAATKRAMLECYPSIDLPSHEQGYAMFNNNVESLYLFEARGAAVFDQIIDQMEVPGSLDYFPQTWTDAGFMRCVARKIFSWKI